VQTLEIALRDWAKGLRTGAVEFHACELLWSVAPGGAPSDLTHCHDFDGVIRPGGRATPSPS
jgi:hypothetical protein